MNPKRWQDWTPFAKQLGVTKHKVLPELENQEVGTPHLETDPNL